MSHKTLAVPASFSVFHTHFHISFKLNTKDFDLLGVEKDERQKPCSNPLHVKFSFVTTTYGKCFLFASRYFGILEKIRLILFGELIPESLILFH